jgi:hypothetical protein
MHRVLKLSQPFNQAIHIGNSFELAATPLMANLATAFAPARLPLSELMFVGLRADLQEEELMIKGRKGLLNRDGSLLPVFLSALVILLSAKWRLHILVR